MIPLFGPENELIDSDGKITKIGYIVLILSTLFGIGCFLISRMVWGKLRNHTEEE